jgi:hypothetical protein
MICSRCVIIIQMNVDVKVEERREERTGDRAPTSRSKLLSVVGWKRSRYMCICVAQAYRC